MRLESRFSGVKEVKRALDNLPTATRRKMIWPAAFASAGYLRDQAVRNVATMFTKEDTGTLAKNIRVYKVRNVDGKLRWAIMVRRGNALHPTKRVNGAKVRIAEYAAVLQFGRRNGTMKAYPWLSTAMARGRQVAHGLFLTRARRGLIEAAQEAKR